MKENGVQHEKKEDLRVQKTKAAIRQTFEDMILEMDYPHITVKELAERARINRKTFYLHYPVMDDLLAEIQAELSAEYREWIKDYDIPRDMDKLIRAFFLFSEEKGEFYEKITSGGSYGSIRQTMIDRVMDRPWEQLDEVKKHDEYRHRIFFAYIYASTLEIYKQWITDGKKIPVEEIIGLATQLICQGTYGFMFGEAGEGET